MSSVSSSLIAAAEACSLLHIVLVPRWTEAMAGIDGLLARISEPRAIAIANSEEEAKLFHRRWPEAAPPLLLLKCPPEVDQNRAVEAVLALAEAHPGRGVAVFLLDGPEVSGYRERHRLAWNRGFASALEERLSDVQIFEFAPSWTSSPPRAR